MNLSKDFFTAVKDRRTYYGISKEAVVSDERIRELVEEAVKHTPSSFNSQSAHVVVLLGEHHDMLWSITKETLRKIVPAESFGPTEEKMNAFGKPTAQPGEKQFQPIAERVKFFSLSLGKFPH